MYKTRNLIKKSFLAVLLVLFSAIFFSCSNNAPELNNAKLSIIFDYETYDSFPTARLSIFVEANSNPRRFESIYVSSNQNELVWDARDLVLAESKEFTYCGTTNLVMPQKEIIPAGEYTIVFCQSDEEQQEIKTVLNYDKELYETKGKDAPSVMQRFTCSRMITIYDEQKKILYYGPRSQSLNDSRGIWNEYREAAEFQESWVNATSTIICNMPVEKVSPDN